MMTSSAPALKSAALLRVAVRREARPREALPRRIGRTFTRGVTLIEILIVLAIVGLIAGGVAVVAIPKYKQAQVDNTKIEVKKIHPIADAYRANHGSECPTLDALKKAKELTGNTMDAWGKPYRITCDGEDLRVASSGPDGIEGNADDISEPAPEKN
jgi:general secretion pathway protein G